MCKKCQIYQKNKEYNYCPICGKLLKKNPFIPVSIASKEQFLTYRKPVHFDKNKIK